MVSAIAARVPNMLSASRMVLALSMLLVEPLSDPFLGLLAAAFLTDVLDGYLARRWHVESRFGSQLDSLADLMMMVVLIVVLLTALEFEDWMIALLASVVAVRALSFAVGVMRFRRLPFVHTLLNKLAAVLIALSPFLIRLIGPDASVAIAGGVAMAAALEYLYISLTSEEYDPDRRSAFLRWGARAGLTFLTAHG